MDPSIWIWFRNTSCSLYNYITELMTKIVEKNQIIFLLAINNIKMMELNEEVISANKEEILLLGKSIR